MLKVVWLPLLLVVGLGLIDQNVLANFTITTEYEGTVVVPHKKVTMMLDSTATGRDDDWRGGFVLQLGECTYYIYCHYRTNKGVKYDPIRDWSNKKMCCHVSDTSTNDVTAEAATQHLHYAPLTVTVDEWRISMMGAKESRILDCPNKGFEKQGSGYTVKIKISKHEDQHSLPGMTLDVQADVFTTTTSAAITTTAKSTPGPTTTSTTTTTGEPIAEIDNTAESTSESETGMSVMTIIIIVIGVIVLLALLMASFVFLVRRYMKKKKAVKLAMSAKVGKAVQSGRSKTPQAAKSKAMKPRAAEDPEEPGLVAVESKQPDEKSSVFG